MYFFLRLSFLFFNTCLLSASLMPDAGEYNYLYGQWWGNEENTPQCSLVNLDPEANAQFLPKAFGASVLQVLKEYKPKPCPEEVLYQLRDSKYPNNQKRDLAIAIIDLRNNGLNIENSGGGFTLLEGRREAKNGCFKKVLWQKFCQDDNLPKRSDAITALELSDEGYFVDYWSICAIKTLWNCIFRKYCSREPFLLKKKAWEVILRDFRVYGRDYYSQHPDVQATFYPGVLASFHKMLTFYKDYVEFQDPDVVRLKEHLCHYILLSPQGRTLQEIEGFLQSNDKTKVDLWVGIRIVLRSDSGPHIYYDEGRVCWSSTPEVPVVSKGGLAVNIGNLFRENPSCDAITFALYKRGFFSVTAFDVHNIVDILIVGDRLRPDEKYMCCGVILGSGSDAEYRQELLSSGLLLQIMDGWPMDIITYVKTRVYPKHFKWKALDRPAPKKTKRKHNQKPSKLAIVSKKPCLEANDMAFAQRKKPSFAEERRLDNAEVDSIDLSTFSPSGFDVDFLLSDSPQGVPNDGEVQQQSTGYVNAAPSFGATNAGRSQDPRYDNLSVLSHSDSHCAEQDSEAEEPLGEIAQRAKTRQQRLLEYLRQRENIFCSFEDVRALYGEGGTKEALFEDVLSLMQSHDNIAYDIKKEKCRLCSFPCVKQAPDAKVSGVVFFCERLTHHSFCALDIRKKTHCLYAHGYRHIPLSTVALFANTGRASGSTMPWSSREQRIEALKDKILKEEEVKCSYEYRGQLPGFDEVLSKDLTCVRKSLQLYTDGRALLQKNMKANRLTRPSRLKGKKNGNIPHPEIFYFFTKNKGRGCSIKELQAVAQMPNSHNCRDIYRNIADLRALKINIVHDGNKFTLLDGERKEKTGSYKKVAWYALNGVFLPYVRDVFLYTSDLGYNPLWAIVEYIFVLKKLCMRDKSLPPHRQVAWNIIVEEDVLRDASYYASHAKSVHLDATDMGNLANCWELYNHIMYDQDPTVAHAAKSILEKHPEGISLGNLQVALLRCTYKSTKKKPNMWNTISGLMRRGYAGQISVTGDLVIWRPDAPKIAPTSNSLLIDLCKIPLGCSVGESTVLLHKQGHFNVSPWDVTQLLDILAFVGYREESKYHALHALWQGREYLTPISYNDEVFIRRIQWFQRTKMLDALRNRQLVDLNAVLQTEEWLSEAEEKGA